MTLENTTKPHKGHKTYPESTNSEHFEPPIIRIQNPWDQNVTARPFLKKFAFGVATHSNLLQTVPASELNTWRILRHQSLQKVLGVLCVVCLWYANVRRTSSNIKLRSYHFFNVVLNEIRSCSKYSQNSLTIVKIVLDVSYFTIALITSAPQQFSSFVRKRATGFEPGDLLSVPQGSLPSSITLLLSTKALNAIPPPEIPGPYLDGDRNIRVPDSRVVKTSISLRNEYFTLHSAHTAKEKVRLLNTIASFIAWSACMPDIDSIVVYEQYGLLWKSEETSPETQLQVLGDATLFELDFVKNKVDSPYSKIILVNDCIGYSHEIFNAGTNVLTVHLSDARIRNPDHCPENVPASSDLMIVPSCNLEEQIYLNGYISISRGGLETSVFTSKRDFDFRVLLDSLNYYALKNKTIYRELDNYSAVSSPCNAAPGILSKIVNGGYQVVPQEAVFQKVGGPE